MKIRVITGICVALLAILLLFISQTIWFIAAISLLCVMATYEILSAAKLLENIPLTVVSFIFSAIMPFFGMFPPTLKPIYPIIILFTAFIVVLFTYKKYTIDVLALTFAYSMCVSVTFSLLVALAHQDAGVIKLITVFLGAWVSDTLAFFTGSLFGKNKLAPDISPKKTVEGFWGGLICDAIVFAVFAAVVAVVTDHSPNILVYAVLGAVCAAAGTAGDLCASLIKRRFGVKDFGFIMPGHGGILDRFDSVTLVAPVVFALFTVYPMF